MSSRSTGTGTVDIRKADVLDISDARAYQTRRRKTVVCASVEPALMLSMRQKLRYKASVGIDEKFAACNWSGDACGLRELNIMVRGLVDAEFGSLRVHRHRQVYIVSHHCMDNLIAGLLRVQFHGRQLRLPISRQGNRLKGAPLHWGVGNSVAEAEIARRYRPGGKPDLD